jgi:hypothetical protein
VGEGKNQEFSGSAPGMPGDGGRNSDLSRAEAQRGRGAEGWGDFQAVVRGLGEEPESKKVKKVMEKEDRDASFPFLFLQSVHGTLHVGLTKKG